MRHPVVTVMPVALLVAISGCGWGGSSQRSLCNDSGILKVGVVEGHGASFGQKAAAWDDATMFRFRDQLMEASRCEVQLEPVGSPDLARARLASGAWDIGFVPPGLMAFAMTRDSPYTPLRSLAAPRQSRSSIAVIAGSPHQQLADLDGARVGLLPRGSLTGFYLPLYNMHGLSLSQVVYALDHAELLKLLEQGKVDAIAWDEARPEPGTPLRRLFVDEHPIPLGAMVMRRAMVKEDPSSFLRSLDAITRELPSALSYVPGELATSGAVPALNAIVGNVESWQLPIHGQPHRVFDPERDRKP